MTATQAPPRWDLDPIFVGLEDRAFNNALEGVYARVDRLVALYDELDIRAREPRAITDADVAALEAVLDATNELQSELRPIATYLYALVSTDSRDDLAAVAPRGAPDPRRAARAARQAARCVARVARRRRARSRAARRRPSTRSRCARRPRAPSSR